MPITVMADAGTQPEAEQVAIKSNRGNQIIGDESEMINALQIHTNIPIFSVKLL